MDNDIGTGIVSIPIAVAYATGQLRYEQAKALNSALMVTEAPDNFAELCMVVKKTLERINEKLVPPQGS